MTGFTPTGNTGELEKDGTRLERRLRETWQRHDRLQTEPICCFERLLRPIPHASHEQNKTLAQPTLLLRPQAVCTWQRNRTQRGMGLVEQAVCVCKAAGTLGITVFAEAL